MEPSLLITGFEPFDGRLFNSSWEAICRLKLKNTILERLPVVWDEPTRRIKELFEEFKPHTILSLGEGHEGWFDIETIARNRRASRTDERGSLPRVGFNCASGTPRLKITTEVEKLHKHLLTKGYPVRISSDAGNFICEETLYCIESLLRENRETLKRVLFIHLPPFETELEINEKSTSVDKKYLEDFASGLLRYLDPEILIPNRSQENY